MLRKRLPDSFRSKAPRPLPKPSASSSVEVDHSPPVDLQALVKQRTLGSLSPELTKAFCDKVRKGVPLDAVCDLLYVPAGTFYRWKSKGELFLSGNFEPREDAIYGFFVQELKRSMGSYRSGLTLRLHSNDEDKNWFKFVAILERRDRRNWAREDPAGGADETLQPDERFL